MPSKATRTAAQQTLPWPYQPGQMTLSLVTQDRDQRVDFDQVTPGNWRRRRWYRDAYSGPIVDGLTVPQVIAAARAYIAMGWRLTD